MYLVYLAGPIMGFTYKEATSWRDYCKNNFLEGIKTLSPLRTETYLEEVEGKLIDSYTDLSKDFKDINYKCFGTDKAITARDRFDCSRADLVLVNLLNTTIVSKGTMIELGWADAFGVPIILVMKAGNIHDHCMIREICSFRVDTLDLGIKTVNGILTPG